MKYKFEVPSDKVARALKGCMTEATRCGCVFSLTNLTVESGKACTEIEMELNENLKHPRYPDLYLNPDGSIVDSMFKAKKAVRVERYETSHFEPTMVASGNLDENRSFSIWRLSPDFFNTIVYPEPITPTFNIDAIELKYSTRVDFFSDEAHSFEEAYRILYECFE